MNSNINTIFDLRLLHHITISCPNCSRKPIARSASPFARIVFYIPGISSCISGHLGHHSYLFFHTSFAPNNQFFISRFEPSQHRRQTRNSPSGQEFLRQTSVKSTSSHSNNIIPLARASDSRSSFFAPILGSKVVE
jgi:hypothetical protein